MTQPDVGLLPGVSCERIDAVVILTFDDPAQRNALTDATLSRLARLAAEHDADRDVRAIVFAGSSKVFASGADVRALLARDAVDIYDGDRAGHWDRLRRLRTPTVAAVSGFCLGAGCELAMMSDLVVASDTARFGLPETQLGLVPGAGGSQLLPRAVGRAVAMDMILTGRLLDAREAERAGLVSRVVAHGSWRTTAIELATAIAARPAVAQRLAKEVVAAAFETPLRAGVDLERKAFAMAFATEDAREGMSAFVEKRTPTWRHR